MPAQTKSATKEIEEKNLGKDGKLWKHYTADIIPELLTEPCQEDDRDVLVADPSDCNQSVGNLKELMRECLNVGIEKALELLSEFPLAEAIRRGKRFVPEADKMIIIDPRIKNKKLRAEEERYVGIPKPETPLPPPQLEKKKEEPKNEQKKAEPTGHLEAQTKKVDTGKKGGEQKNKAEPKKTEKKARKAPIKKRATGITKRAAEKKKSESKTALKMVAAPRKAPIKKVDIGVTKKAAEKKKAEPKGRREAPIRQVAKKETTRIPKVSTGVTKKEADKKKIEIWLEDRRKDWKALAAALTRQPSVPFEYPQALLAKHSAHCYCS